MALYRKYRPKNFSDLIGEEHISGTLIQGVKTGKLSHAYLLTGPRGTGKTSTARLLAKAINCETIAQARKENKESSGEPCNKCSSCLEIGEGRSIDIVEIDAASHTKVDEIREVIENARFLPTKAGKKVYIIDEVHMLSNSSFNALLKTLEEPPSHVVFILATTEVHKLPATILSRTQRYDFHRVSKEDIIKNLKIIAKKEKIEIEDDALDVIAVSAEGGHRDAISLFEQIYSASKGKIIKDSVTKILGIAEHSEVYRFLGAIFNDDPEEGLKIAHRLYEGGISLTAFNKSVIEVLRKIMVYKMSGKFLFDDTKENLKTIEELGKKSEIKDIIKKIEIFIKAGQLLKDISYPILPIEMAVVESCTLDQNHESGIMNQESSTVKQIKKDGLKGVDEKKKDAASAEEGAGVPASEGMQGEKTHDSHSSLSLRTHSSESKTKFQIRDSIPVAVLQMTQDIWEKVIEITRQSNPTLAALLKDARPIEVKKEKVILGVKFPFHKDKISEEKNRKYLETVFGQITGQKCILSCELADLRPKPKKEMSDDELQKAAEEIFG